MKFRLFKRKKKVPPVGISICNFSIYLRYLKDHHNVGIYTYKDGSYRYGIILKQKELIGKFLYASGYPNPIIIHLISEAFFILGINPNKVKL